MKVLVDCRNVRTDGRHDGISRYVTGIVTALGRLHPVTMLISDERQLAMLPDLPWARIRPVTDPREPLVARQVNRLRPDVVFSPMQTMGSFGRRYRLVLTLHDLIYYRHRTPPREFAPWVRLLWRIAYLSYLPQRVMLNGADAVVTVSRTTRDEMLEHRLTKRPITVAANAADRVDPAVDAGAAPDRSLLYMGSFIGYKNVATLVRAAALLPDYTLHLLSPITAAERHGLETLAPAARLQFHDGVTDEEYTALIRRATALVTASLDEGFGLPVVEAMAHGLPVITSDIPIFREVGGDAALVVPARDPAAFAAAVRRLEDPTERIRRSVAVRRQAERFDWEVSARAVLTELRRLAGT